jgi:hypothetical protein
MRYRKSVSRSEYGRTMFKPPITSAAFSTLPIPNNVGELIGSTFGPLTGEE